MLRRHPLHLLEDAVEVAVLISHLSGDIIHLQIRSANQILRLLHPELRQVFDEILAQIQLEALA
ncbi:hypothetical protein D3C75_1212850 [compost metagenome]